VATVGSALGRGLANLVAMLDPELIVIGGGLGSVGDMMLDPAREALAASLFGRPHAAPPSIVTAAFGERATAIGAALRAAEELG
jgi:glucokinase